MTQLTCYRIPNSPIPARNTRAFAIGFWRSPWLRGITYLDRVCIAQTANDMMCDLSLSKKQMGFVFSAFTIAYAALRDAHGSLGATGSAREPC